MQRIIALPRLRESVSFEHLKDDQRQFEGLLYRRKNIDAIEKDTRIVHQMVR